MTDHPCKGLSRAHRRAFERIAINQFPQAKKMTIDRLLTAGLIQRTSDGKGYFVPILVHYRWCQWASENVKEETP